MKSIIEAPCIRVARIDGESTRKKLLSQQALDNNLKIKADGDYIYIPVSKPVEGLGEIRIELFEALDRVEQVSEIPGAYELIGNIAVIDQHEKNVTEIAECLLKHKNIKTVYQAKSSVSGEYRTREIAFIKGEKKTETIYRENGCRYLLDVAEVYFTPRLATERMRIVRQIKNGDKIIDMFSGIGPFSIPIAKSYPDSYVIAIDKNPVAVKYLKNNIRLNRIKNIEIIQGDAKEALKAVNYADHVIMNLPHSGLDFLYTAFMAVKKCGTVHFYAISHENDLYDSLTGKINNIAEKASRKIVSLDRRIVRPYAPYQYNICIDLKTISSFMGK